MPAPIAQGFQSIPEDHPLHRLTAPLIAAHNHIEERMHGTAFVIAPELAFTAKHVVIDYLDKIQNENIEQRMADGGHHTAKMTFFMFLLVPMKDGRRIPLTVANTYFPGSGDIALLRLSKPVEVDWADLAPYPTLRLLPPDVGTAIEALGYPDGSANRRPDGVVELHTWPRISTGIVQEVHGQRRDFSLLKYPCFQVNARLDDSKDDSLHATSSTTFTRRNRYSGACVLVRLRHLARGCRCAAQSAHLLLQSSTLASSAVD